MAPPRAPSRPASPPTPLPVDAVLPEVTAALSQHASVVLVAPPGAGKTTRVPPALLASGLAGDGRVVVLEPRRVAARAAARRMAEEGGWELGREVGYQVRFDRRAGRETRILVVTEGVFLNLLQADPFLEGVGAVVFDELHERGLASDLALAMSRRVQQEVRGDLPLVAMSATLAAEPVAAFLGGCPVVESRGRRHPVEVEYLDRPDPRSIPARAAAGVTRVLDRTGGDVLVFLPGVGEIRRTVHMLEGLAASRDLAVLPLYGDLPPEEQDAALKPWDRRKVILATNVAETSVTIDGVTAVVDTGMARILRYDAAWGLDRLELVRISAASAEQRAGRAGRQGPGLALRLWTEHDHRSLPAFTPPEVTRVDVAAPTLQLMAWGESDPATFGWLDPPAPAALAAARELLELLGAADRHGITRLGRAMARLPVHPRLARLLVEGHRRGYLVPAALLAALLSERDPFVRQPDAVPPPPSRSDVLDRLEALETFARSRRTETGHHGKLKAGAAHHILRAGRQLEAVARRHLEAPPPAGMDRDEALLRCLLAAYPDRLARRREAGSRRGVLLGGGGVRLADASAVSAPDLFVCVDLAAGRRGERAEALVRQASAVEAQWLPPEEVTTAVEVELDRERQRVVAYQRTRIRDLLLDERQCPPPADEAADVLASAAAADLHAALPLDDPEVAAFLARVRCLREWMPELELPAFDDEELQDLLPTLAAGKRSFAELRRAPLLQLLQGTLSHRQRQALNREAPERLEVPSGSRIRLTYEPGQPPVLAARIQELFGLGETPRLAAGRVPVLLHLLAPNQRPQQVTRDLASFWANTYPEVRKELAGRYPKHAWPQDPTTATPERRPRRRKGTKPP